MPFDTPLSGADPAQFLEFFTAPAPLDTSTCDVIPTDVDPALTLPMDTAPLDTPTSGTDPEHSLGTVADLLDPLASDKDTAHSPPSNLVYLSLSPQDTDLSWRTPLKHPANLDSPYQDPVLAHQGRDDSSGDYPSSSAYAPSPEVSPLEPLLSCSIGNSSEFSKAEDADENESDKNDGNHLDCNGLSKFLTELYGRFNPAKIPRVPRCIQFYHGHQQSLDKQLQDRYGEGLPTRKLTPRKETITESPPQDPYPSHHECEDAVGEYCSSVENLFDASSGSEFIEERDGGVPPGGEDVVGADDYESITIKDLQVKTLLRRLIRVANAVLPKKTVTERILHSVKMAFPLKVKIQMSRYPVTQRETMAALPRVTVMETMLATLMETSVIVILICPVERVRSVLPMCPLLVMIKVLVLLMLMAMMVKFVHLLVERLMLMCLLAVM